MFLDLSPTKLKTYRGSSPKPDDFDSFWDSQLAEMDSYLRAVSLELTPREECSWGNTEAFDVWFTSFDGARIYAKYMRPANSGKSLPLLFKCHGYSGSSGSWQDLFNQALQGVHVLSVDCRGQGGYSLDEGNNTRATMFGQIVTGVDSSDPSNLLFVKIFKDLYLLITLAVQEFGVDSGRIMSCGGSQGGALSLMIAALYPSINKTVSVYPFLCDYKRVYDMGLHKMHAYQGLGNYLMRFYPSLEHRERFWERLGYIDIQFLMPRIQAEVIFLTGMMDEVCPPSTQFAAYNRIESEKQALIYPEYGHEGLPHWDDILTHVLQCLIESQPLGDINDWLRKVLRPQSESQW